MVAPNNVSARERAKNAHTKVPRLDGPMCINFLMFIIFGINSIGNQHSPQPFGLLCTLTQISIQTYILARVGYMALVHEYITLAKIV